MKCSNSCCKFESNNPQDFVLMYKHDPQNPVPVCHNCVLDKQSKGYHKIPKSELKVLSS